MMLLKRNLKLKNNFYDLRRYISYSVRKDRLESSIILLILFAKILKDIKPLFQFIEVELALILKISNLKS